MKKALVLGASGGIGSAITFELISRGIKVIAFARNIKKLKALYEGNNLVEIKEGDVFNYSQLMDAAKGAECIYHAVNLPYQEWQTKQEPMINNILQVSENVGAKLAVVDNIYSYAESTGEKASEEYEKNPQTKKGKIRLKIGKKVMDSKVQAFIAHFPDFYGPYAESTVLHYFLQSIIDHKKAMFVGDKKVPREYIYTPDGAKALVELSLHEKAYGQCWNIPGTGVITGEEIIKIIQEITGYSRKVSTVTKNMVRFIGIFDPSMKEYVEMYDLTQKPLILNGEKLECLIGPIQKTSYKEGLEGTLNTMKEKGLITI
ncbi:SDR family NAD(P)-dependent oxidoreductase [Metabacillus endolithicus]|uniref:SDR family NAD(P)-dependent oxidoreductase n=2 Tax=Metabacillus TaxID=2675233 RepID=A0ABW5C6K0_9BACI